MGLSALVALAAAAAACGNDDKKETKTPSLCEGVVCAGESVCNPDNGLCVCGEGDLICSAGSVCVVEPTPTCISDRCEFTSCTNGQSCDPTDGLCKCGGDVCGDDEQCIQGNCVAGDACLGVVCLENETCNPDDGSCRCGDGAGCGFGERCDEGVCKEDRCAGNPCGNGLTCSQEDGLCHCGGETGPVCSNGEACVVDGAGARCEGVDLCADAETRCGAGTTCDRTDGTCRCGGLGPDAPICGSGQTCHDGRCVGGELCADEATRCTGGTTCDPEDGVCKCGGLFGDICGAGTACLNDGTDAACVQTCNPLLQTTGCGAGQACYFDADAVGGGVRYCAPAGNIPASSTCRASTDCVAGYHCDMAPGAATGKCMPFCNVDDRPQCGGTGFCAPLNSDLDNLGVCVSR